MAQSKGNTTESFITSIKCEKVIQLGNKKGGNMMDQNGIQTEPLNLSQVLLLQSFWSY